MKANYIFSMLKIMVILCLFFVLGSYSEAKKEESAKELPVASVQYLCPCSDKSWRQDSDVKKACPYCGEAMPDCGILQGYFPKPGLDYAISDFALPNATCPVMRGRKINPELKINHQGRDIFFCCGGCPQSFQANPQRFMRNIPLLEKAVKRHESHQQKAEKSPSVVGHNHADGSSCPLH
jgi:YHS domain-containing protein